MTEIPAEVDEWVQFALRERLAQYPEFQGAEQNVTTVGLLGLVIAVLLGVEAFKLLTTAHAENAGNPSGGSPSGAGGTTANPTDSSGTSGSFTPTGGTSPAPDAPAGDIAHNVQYLANWARNNGIDPRVALTILAGESGGRSNPGTGDAAIGGSYGPIQLYAPVHDAGYQPGVGASEQFKQAAQHIEYAIGVMGGRWLGALRGVSYAQFLTNPEHYYDAAQGGDPATVARNLANSGNFSSVVNGWCAQYGVC